VRAVHGAVQKFIDAQVAASQPVQTPDVAALVREKLALAAAISEPWR
jgi:hypothetical protein